MLKINIGLIDINIGGKNLKNKEVMKIKQCFFFFFFLIANWFDEEASKVIGEGLKVNKSLTKLDFSSGNEWEINENCIKKKKE